MAVSEETKMKTTTKAIIVLVSLSLIFSLTSFVIIITGNAGNIRIFSNHPATSQRPIPTQTPYPNIMEINYNETYREVIGNNTRIVLTLNATLFHGNGISINYSQFYLNLYVGRLGLNLPVGTAYPINDGSFPLGNSNKSYIFQLVFEFSSNNSNGMDIVPTRYNLDFNGPASIQWT
jgi:hypothetical protein